MAIFVIFVIFFAQKLLRPADFRGNSGRPADILYSHSDIDRDHFHILYHIDLTQIQESQNAFWGGGNFRLTIYAACYAYYEYYE